MERFEKRILIIVSAVMLVLVATVLIIRIPVITGADNTENTFKAPDRDSSSVTGVPKITDKGSNYNSLELPISDGSCTLAMDATPLLENNNLHIFFTSNKENSVYVRIILYTQDDKEVGSSGLIHPDEYIDFVKVTKAVTSGASLKAKILTFEPDTYYSLGSATISLNVR